AEGLQSLFQSLCQLVRTGSVLKSALDALQFGDGFFGVHALHQSADAFQISVAASGKRDIVNLSVLQLKRDQLGTGSVCFVYHTRILLSERCISGPSPV